MDKYSPCVAQQVLLQENQARGILPQAQIKNTCPPQNRTQEDLWLDRKLLASLNELLLLQSLVSTESRQRQAKDDNHKAYDTFNRHQ